jgi:hypothetical protein
LASDPRRHRLGRGGRLSPAWLRVLSHPKLGRCLALFAVMLSAPSLWLRFRLDDYVARFIYTDLPGAKQLYHAYTGGYGLATGDPRETLWQVEQGYAPWWVNPRLLTSLMRPLSELTHRLDIALWPDTPALMHAQSLAWLALLVLMATRLYRHALPLGVAGLAAVLFAFDHTHGYSVGYVPNRHALVTALFGLACLDQHLRYRQQANTAAGIWAALLYVLTLLSGESGLAIAAYLFAYACFVERGPVLRRARTLAPYLAISVVWRVAYTALGYGAHGSGIYIDPIREPGHFLQAALTRVPLLFLGQFFAPPAELHSILQPNQARLMLACAWLFCLLLTAACAPLLRRDRLARFWAAGFCLSLLPASTTLPNNRQLLLASVGAMGLLAQLWQHYAPQLGQRAPWATTWRASLSALLTGSHLFVSPLMLPLTTCMIALTAPIHRGIVGGSDPIAGHDAIFVTAPDIYAVKFVQLERRIAQKPLARRFRALSFGPQPVVVLRETERSLVLEYPRGLVDTAFMDMFRDSRVRMRPGEHVRLQGLDIAVLDTTPDGRLQRVRFDFDAGLEAPLFVGRKRWLRPMAVARNRHTDRARRRAREAWSRMTRCKTPINRACAPTRSSSR